MSKVPAGTKLRDNDPRMNGRIVTIEGQDAQGCFYRSERRIQHIKDERIFTDGRARHQGFNVVSYPPVGPGGVVSIDGLRYDVV